MKKTSLFVSGVVVLAVGLFVLSGCNKITGSSVRRNMSPEKTTLARSREEHRNDVAKTLDTNARQITDDLDFLFLLDRPSRGSRYPVP